MGMKSVNKTQLIDKIAANADITKKRQRRVLDAMVASITESLQKVMTLHWWASVHLPYVIAQLRTAVIHKQVKEIQIAAAKVPAFRAGKRSKDAVNQ